MKTNRGYDERSLDFMGIKVIVSSSIPEGTIAIVSAGKGYIDMVDGRIIFHWLREPQIEAVKTESERDK